MNLEDSHDQNPSRQIPIDLSSALLSANFGNTLRVSAPEAAKLRKGVAALLLGLAPFSLSGCARSAPEAPATPERAIVKTVSAELGPVPIEKVTEAQLPQAPTTTSVAQKPSTHTSNTSLSELNGSLALFSRELRRLSLEVLPSVVHIETQKKGLSNNGTQQISLELGSGVIVSIDNEPCVLTNCHVVKDNETLKVFLRDRSSLIPNSTKFDETTDIALLRFSKEAWPALKPLTTGDTDSVEIGELVLACGSPYGYRHSVSLGMVSALHRETRDNSAAIQNFIQTDASINPGNSGGPLINLSGQVIGLNTAIASQGGGNDGVAFSIPIDLALKVAKDLKQHGKVIRPYLGITMEDTRGGVLIKSVTANSPAAEAGLKVDDVISRINGKEIENSAHVRALLCCLGTGGECQLKLTRGTELKELRTKLVEKPSE